ncbi:MAG: hypothetical protein IJV50_11650 [Lachnospiraceae bacterium]|nr:hypothetical protein [Lachnospiraceae bacterium]
MRKAGKIVLGCVIALVVVGVGLTAYVASQQWTWKGYSRLVGITIAQEKELEQIYEGTDGNVYTYGLTACDVGKFIDGSHVALTEALEDGLTTKDMIKYMKKKNVDGLTVYEGEAYQIIQSDADFILSDRSAAPVEVVKLVANQMRE